MHRLNELNDLEQFLLVGNLMGVMDQGIYSLPAEWIEHPRTGQWGKLSSPRTISFEPMSGKVSSHFINRNKS